MRITRLTKILSLLALTGLAACSPATVNDASTPSHQHHDHHEAEAGATETDDRSPRIVVSTETGITVLDADLHQLSTFTTPARPNLTTMHDDRHVVAVMTRQNQVQILDSGSWAQGHGDHFHFYTAEPKMLETPIDGGRPIHVVPNTAANATGVFFDADGKGVLIDSEELKAGDLAAAHQVTTNGEQHGLAMPMPGGGYFVSQPGDQELPDTVELHTEDGALTSTFNCDEMHGEVARGTMAAFGCLDSVLIVQDGTETRVPAPDTSGERVGGLVATADGHTLLGDWGKTSLVFITDGMAKVVEVGVPYSNRAVTPDGQFAVLGTDGTLRIYNAAGEQTKTFPLTSPWEMPEGHGALTPSVTAGELEAANMVWVADPAANKVFAVDLFSDNVTEVEVPGAPGSIVVTNAS